MSKALSSAEIIAALGRAGFLQVSQKGSHVKFRKVTPERTLTVIVKHPAKDVPKGTVSSILKQAGMSRDEFDKLL